MSARGNLDDGGGGGDDEADGTTESADSGSEEQLPENIESPDSPASQSSGGGNQQRKETATEDQASMPTTADGRQRRPADAGAPLADSEADQPLPAGRPSARTTELQIRDQGTDFSDAEFAAERAAARARANAILQQQGISNPELRESVQGSVRMQTDLERGVDFTVENGRVRFTEEYRQQFARERAASAITRETGVSVSAEDVSVSNQPIEGRSGQPGLELESDARERIQEERRERRLDEIDQQLDEEFNQDLERGEDYVIENGQVEFTTEGKEKIRTGPQGQTFLDKQIEHLEEKTGVDIIPGEGDLVQDIERDLVEMSVAQEEGRGLLPSGDEIGSTVQEQQDIGEGDAAAPQPPIGPGAGVSANSVNNFYRGVGEFTEGVARRGAQLFDAGGLILGIGRSAEFAGEFAFNAALAGGGPNEELRGEGRRKASEQAVTVAEGVNQVATDTQRSFARRPRQTLGSGAFELGLASGGRALARRASAAVGDGDVDATRPGSPGTSTVRDELDPLVTPVGDLRRFFSDERGSLQLTGSGSRTDLDVDNDATDIDLSRTRPFPEGDESAAGRQIQEQRLLEQRRSVREGDAPDPPEPDPDPERKVVDSRPGGGFVASRRGGRTVDPSPDRSRSGPRLGQESQNRRRSANDTDLTPREQQLAAQLDTDTPRADLRDFESVREATPSSDLRNLSEEATGSTAADAASTTPAITESDMTLTELAVTEARSPNLTMAETGATLDAIPTTETVADTGLNVDTGTQPAVDNDLSPNVDTNIDTNTDTRSGTDTGTDIRTNTDAGTDTSNETDTGTESDVGTDIRTQTDTTSRQDRTNRSDRQLDPNRDREVDRNRDRGTDRERDRNRDRNRDPSREFDRRFDRRFDFGQDRDTDDEDDETDDLALASQRVVDLPERPGAATDIDVEIDTGDDIL